jgi:hypothetical protein
MSANLHKKTEISTILQVFLELVTYTKHLKGACTLKPTDGCPEKDSHLR